MAERSNRERRERREESKNIKGNTGLPFGLCKKYNIPIQKNWTPKDAWDALKGKTGKSVKQIYNSLEDNKQEIDKEHLKTKDGREIIDYNEMIDKKYQSQERSFKEIADKVGEETAEKMVKSVVDFTGSLYTAIRNKKKTEFNEYREAIENFIKISPVYNGRIYRGLKIRPDKMGEFMKDLKDSLAGKKNIDMKGISSWSARQSVAEGFSHGYTGDIGFVFNCKNRAGVPISNLSDFPSEDEVLHSDNTRWKVKKINKENDYKYYIDVEEVAV